MPLLAKNQVQPPQVEPKGMDEDEYDPDFDNMAQQQDTDNAWYLTVAGLLGAAIVLDSLNPSGPADSPEFPPNVEMPGDVSDETFSQILQMGGGTEDTALGTGPTDDLKYTFSDEELRQYQEMSEELHHQGRIEDPKTTEIKSFDDAARINDNIGMFGGTEAYKAGMLDAYEAYSDQTGTMVMIPWVPAGDNTCDECQELADNGPYLPWEYPEPPHYGCQCEPGDPVLMEGPIDDIMGNGDSGSTDESESEDYKEVPRLDDYVENDQDWTDTLKDLDSNELESLESYHDDSDVLNNYLRTGELPEGALVDEEDIKSEVSDLDNLIDQSKTPESMVLYRGVGTDLGDAEIGSTMNDKAFLSTSTNFEDAEGFTDEHKNIMEIQYPKGSNGLPVSEALKENDLRVRHNENELLLPRDTKFEVIGNYEKDGEWGGNYHVVQVKPV